MPPRGHFRGPGLAAQRAAFALAPCRFLLLGALAVLLASAAVVVPEEEVLRTTSTAAVWTTRSTAIEPGTDENWTRTHSQQRLSPRPWSPPGAGDTEACASRFIVPEPAPERATDLNGVRLPDTCFLADREHHVFVIGDWGGVLSSSGQPPPVPADRRAKFFVGFHREFVVGADDVAQLSVARQMRLRSAETAPDYILNVGDNFYWGGVLVKCGGPPDNVTDPSGQWRHVFEDVYRGGGLDGKQWLGVLGNHDFGGFLFTHGWDQAIGYTWTKGPPSSNRWVTPALYWTVRVRYSVFSVDYFFVDTNVFDAYAPNVDDGHNLCSAAHNLKEGATCGVQGPASVEECPKWFQRLWSAQLEWLDHGLGESRIEWQVVVTHFPPEHGRDQWVPLAAKHGIDLLITGHRHQQEVHYLQASNFMRPTAVLVSGGGGGITSESPPKASGEDDQYGFMDLTLGLGEIKVEAISHTGQIRSTTCVRRRVPGGGMMPPPPESMCDGVPPGPQPLLTTTATVTTTSSSASATTTTTTSTSATETGTETKSTTSTTRTSTSTTSFDHFQAAVAVDAQAASPAPARGPAPASSTETSRTSATSPPSTTVTSGAGDPSATTSSTTTNEARHTSSVVELLFRVFNLDFDRLTGDDDLSGAFNQAVAAAIIEEMRGDLSPDRFVLTLSAGSVAVHASIMPPRGSTPEEAEVAAQRTEDVLKFRLGDLGRRIGRKVAFAPGMTKAATGTIGVDGMFLLPRGNRQHSAQPGAATMTIDDGRGLDYRFPAIVAAVVVAMAAWLYWLCWPRRGAPRYSLLKDPDDGYDVLAECAPVRPGCPGSKCDGRDMAAMAVELVHSRSTNTARGASVRGGRISRARSRDGQDERTDGELRRRSAAKFLQELAERAATPEGREALAECFGAIVESLQEFSEDASVQEAGCTALCNAALGVDVAGLERKQNAVAAGALEVTAAALRRHCGNPSVLAAACGALRILCIGMDEASGSRRRRAADAGAVEAVVAALLAHPADALLQEQGCGALCNLCRGVDAASFVRRQSAARAGAPAAVAAAILGHMRSTEVTANACASLRNLCLGKDQEGQARKQAAIDEGAIEALVEAMRQHSRDPLVQECAFGALGNLCSGSAPQALDNRVRAARAGALRAVVEGLRLHAGSPTVQEDARYALRQLVAGSPALRNEALAAGAEATLLE